MEANKIRLSDLESFDDCEAAIAAIEKDHVNYYGDLKHWYSGHVTILKEGPKKKIAAIQRKQDRFDVD
jgi:UDP-N-acetylmuramoylalanine-D-glutamate ligase